jgi:ubiquitin-protein ligase
MSTLTYANVRKFFDHDRGELFNNKIAISIDESNFYIVHFLFAGSEGTPFEGGYYYGIMILNEQHPFKAPTQYMLSPSGRFVFAPKYPPSSDYAICTSNTGFHQENWSPQTSLEQYLIGWRSFFNDKGTETIGIGSLSTSDTDKQKIAKTTVAYLMKFEKFKEVFSEIHNLLKNGINPFPNRAPTKKISSEKKIGVNEKMKNLGLDSDDEDKPKKKKAVKDESDEDKPKKKKIVKDESDEDKPKKKKVVKDDSDEDKPKKKKIIKKNDSESEEEKPKKKSSKKSLDTDSEEEVKKKKKSKKKSLDSDSEEEVKKKKKKKPVYSSDSDSE